MKFFLCLLFATVTLLAQQSFPPAGWKNLPDPVASKEAGVGGEISEFAGQSPKSLNYYLDNNVFSAKVFGMLYEPLISMNSQTLEYEPALARAWTIADDKRSFTFELDPKARWSDGKPITAEDVLFTYRVIMNPQNMTGVHKVSLERLQEPEILSPLKIRVVAKQIHWRNLGAAGGFEILPKHFFEGKDFNKQNFEFPVVSGPYRIKELREGTSAILERRQDWWRRDWPNVQNIGNFERVKYRFYADRNNAFEAFMKGEIDFFAVYTSRLWMTGTATKAFRKNWIRKQKIFNHRPVGFQGFAMNLRRPPFDDRRVRKALAHLVNRAEMNSTLMYNQYFLHRSYYEDLYSKENPCPNQLVEFDKDAARKLLAEAGWRANPKTGILEKDGKPFEFRFLSRDSNAKFLHIFNNALKDVGINMVIDQKDWSAWARDMDEFNYDMTWAAWGAGLFKDPEGMWHSKEAERKGGNNITGFKDPRVDKLIEKQITLFDINKRHEICRQIDQIIFNEHPYVLLWNINYTRLLYWNKFGTPPTVIGKYSMEGSDYWWLDEDAEAELDDAMDTDETLPGYPAEIHYDELFSGNKPALK